MDQTNDPQNPQVPPTDVGTPVEEGQGSPVPADTSAGQI